MRLAPEGGGTSTFYEVRVAKGICNESVILRANVSLKGGYDPAQNWIRNPALYQSIISTTNAVTIFGYGDLTSAYPKTSVEGFKIQTANSGTNLFNSIILNNASVTFKNNHMVYSTTSAQAAPGMSLIYVTKGNIALDSNLLSATTVSSTVGHRFAALFVDGASLIATNNIFHVSANATGISSSVVRIENTVAGGSAVFNATNNVFFLISSSGLNIAPVLDVDQLTGTFNGNFERNVLFALGAANNNRCGVLIGSTKFTTMKSNALIDCNHGGSAGVWHVNGTNINVGYAGPGPWTAASNAATVGVNLDTAAGLAQAVAANNPVNCAGACAALSGNRGGNTIPGVPTLHGNPAIVFQGYAAGDPASFTFKPNTIADMDNNGAYDASIDAGANTATAGLVALP